MRIIRWVAFAIGMTIFLALGTAYLLGRTTDAEFVGRGSVKIYKDPRQVWAVLKDPGLIPRWSKGIDKAEPQPDGSWKFTGKQDSTATMSTMRFEVLEEGRVLKSKIVEAPQPISSGEWRYEVLPDGPYTEVKLEARLRIDNPWLRFGLRYLTDANKHTQSELEQLKNYLK
jgi:hypothetical protein